MADAPLPGPPLRPRPARGGLRRRLRARASGLAPSDLVVALPVLSAAAWLAGLPEVGVAIVLALPVAVLGLSAAHRRRGRAPKGPVTRAAVTRAADGMIARADAAGGGLLMLLAGIDAAFAGEDWTGADADRAMDVLATRARAALRDADAVFRLGDRTLAVLVQASRRADLDLGLAVADRLQAALAEPVPLAGRVWRADAHVGLCSDVMAPERSGAGLLGGAACALDAARVHEAGAVRAFTPELRIDVETGHRLTRQVPDALAEERIVAWFQPQVEAGSGRLRGFEALARWDHPDLGLLAPRQFLPAVAAAGQDVALGERVLRAALAALAAWDGAGLGAPRVGVNFSLEELRDPRLAERVAWEVDRAGVDPDRVSVEILETVTLEGAEETILRNVRALKAAGLRLDLDDFGTGAASIAHIARFGVHRIKIDRSFVAGLGAPDGEADRMIAAILRLAAELGIETLAEGVETDAQAARLAEMGCAQLQGFAVARPMPLADTLAWARRRAPPAPDLARLVPAGRA